MGSCNFETIQIGKFKDHKEAYNEACKEAYDYYGHQEGYNGTISTTSHSVHIANCPSYGTKAFYKWEDEQLERLSKRGKCIAVEIKGKKFKELKERSGLSGKKGIRAFYFFGWGAE